MPNRVTARRCKPARAAICLSIVGHDQEGQCPPLSRHLARSGGFSLTFPNLWRYHGGHRGHSCGAWGRSCSAGSWGHSLGGWCISGARGNTARYLAEFRVAVSGWGGLRKVRPGILLQKGMPFPRWGSTGKRVPLWSVKTGCAFRAGRIVATEQNASLVTRPRSARRVRPGCPLRSRRRRPPTLRGHGSPS